MPRPARIPPNTDDQVWNACWSAKDDAGLLVGSTHRRIRSASAADATIIAERFAADLPGWTLAGVYLADHRDTAPFIPRERTTP